MVLHELFAPNVLKGIQCGEDASCKLTVTMKSTSISVYQKYMQSL